MQTAPRRHCGGRRRIPTPAQSSISPLSRLAVEVYCSRVVLDHQASRRSRDVAIWPIIHRRCHRRSRVVVLLPCLRPA